MLRALALSLALLLPTVLKAENLGASYLALCSRNWPCAASLQASPGAVGFLWETFRADPACPCLQRLIQSGTLRYLRVHISNGTCFPQRGRACGPQELFHGLSIARADRKLRRKDARLLKRFTASAGALKPLLPQGVALRLSPVLESPLSDPARKVLMDLTRSLFPGVPVVDSVLTQRCLPGAICEKHGSRPSFPPGVPCIADTDGEDFIGIDLPEYRRRTARCEAAYLWTPGFNLLSGQEQSFIPPVQRKARPGKVTFLAVSRAIAP